MTYFFNILGRITFVFSTFYSFKITKKEKFLKQKFGHLTYLGKYHLSYQHCFFVAAESSGDFCPFFFPKASGSVRFLGYLACTALLRSIHSFSMIFGLGDFEGHSINFQLLLLEVDQCR